MEINLVIIWGMDHLAAPTSVTTRGAPWWGPLAGTVAFFLDFGILAGAASVLGGLLGARSRTLRIAGAAVAVPLHRRTGPNGSVRGT